MIDAVGCEALVGAATWDLPPGATLDNNPTLARGELGSAASDAYRPRAGVLHATLADGDGAPLVPERQYLHPRRSRALAAPPAMPGALQPTALK